MSQLQGGGCRGHAANWDVTFPAPTETQLPVRETGKKGGEKSPPISSEVLCVRAPLPRAQACTKGLRKEGDLLIPSAGQKINEKQPRGSPSVGAKQPSPQPHWGLFTDSLICLYCWEAVIPRLFLKCLENKDQMLPSVHMTDKWEYNTRILLCHGNCVGFLLRKWKTDVEKHSWLCGYCCTGTAWIIKHWILGGSRVGLISFKKKIEKEMELPFRCF